MLAYIYNTETEARKNLDKLNVHFGISESDGIVTKTVAHYFKNGEEWAIPYDPSFEVVLGDPVELILLQEKDGIA